MIGWQSCRCSSCLSIVFFLYLWSAEYVYLHINDIPRLRFQTILDHVQLSCIRSLVLGRLEELSGTLRRSRHAHFMSADEPPSSFFPTLQRSSRDI